MFKKVLLMLAIVMMLAGVAYARDVSVSSVGISNVNPGAGTCTINYTLTRTQPAIDANQPIWVFVKYRLSTDTDYTGWQDTDDHKIEHKIGGHSREHHLEAPHQQPDQHQGTQGGRGKEHDPESQ